MEETVKKKRVCCRVGDIFYSDLDCGVRRFLQFVCKDKTNLGTHVIRVFKGAYSLDSEPNVEDIMSKGTDFYTHTMVGAGVKLNCWNKYKGKSPIDFEDLEKAIFFAIDNPFEMNLLSFALDEITNPFIKLIPFVYNRKCFVTFKANKKYDIKLRLNKLEKENLHSSGIFAPVHIKGRLYYGFYMVNSDEILFLKKIPNEYAHVYVKTERKTETIYIHFHGELAVEEVIVLRDGTKIKLTLEENEKDGYKLWNQKFSEGNWDFKEYYSIEYQFREVWTES